MTSREISEQQAKVYLAVRATAGRWVTNPDLYELVPNVAHSTIRLFTLQLFKLGILERLEVHPFFRYRWSTRREGRDHDFEVRMETACEAFGMKTGANGKGVMPNEGD